MDIDFNKSERITYDGDIISIDPMGCIDIDDAISYKLNNNKIELGIHIADPSSYIDINSDIGKELMYFVDDSPAKQGFYSPVDHIPIISREQAEKNLPDYFIILAPNYSNEIMSKEAKFIKNGGKFIIPKNEISII